MYKNKNTIALILVVISILYYMNNGNPIAMYKNKKFVEDYVEKEYKGEMYVRKIFYNKPGAYTAGIQSKKKESLYFLIEIDDEKIIYDEYKEKKFNKIPELEYEYRNLVGIENRSIFEGPKIIMFFRNKGPNQLLSLDGEKFELEKDREYDVKKLGRKYGIVVYYAEVDELNAQAFSTRLLSVKDRFEKAGVEFSSINMDIMGEEDGKSKWYRLENFRYEDIYRDGLDERVEKALINIGELNDERPDFSNLLPKM
ncbi:hypothetical protein [Peptoniphilus asaccharolyticus]